MRALVLSIGLVATLQMPGINLTGPAAVSVQNPALAMPAIALTGAAPAANPTLAMPAIALTEAAPAVVRNPPLAMPAITLTR